MNNLPRLRSLAFMAVMVLLLVAGCARTGPQGDPAGSDQIATFADDIKDITVPSEMRWDRNGSMVIKTESFRGGVFVYKGKAEVLSLKDYMVSSMQGNQWRHVGETASKDIMLAFIKPNKSCMAIISDGLLGRTVMRLYVAIDKTGASGSGGGSYGGGSYGGGSYDSGTGGSTGTNTPFMDSFSR
ncbi:MAG: hypothetical protein ACOX5Z_11950 [Desulfobulbus sp.]